ELVEVTAETARRNPEARAGRFICLTVCDTGDGMDSETSHKIFDPFFTTKSDGMGLGLSVVYGIVKQHQGWIEVSSRVDHGSTFKVFLPVAASPAEHKPIRQSEAPTGMETVLVVEDEPALRELVVRQLKKQGYRILQARTGTEALALWPEHCDEIDLLFTDMLMPDNVSGRDLAETLLAQK